MPHTPAADPTVLDEAMTEAIATNNLVDGLHLHATLLTEHGSSVPEFLHALDGDEREFFRTCPPALLGGEVEQWLAMMTARPVTTEDDRRVRVQHGYERRYEHMASTAASPRELFALRLHSVFTVRKGVLTWEPFDVPWASEKDFLVWLSPEAIAWSATLSWEVFRAAARSWLEDYFWRVGLPRLSGAPVTPMQGLEHQQTFVHSDLFDLCTRQLAEEEGVEWELDLPPEPGMGITIVSG